MLMPLDLRGAGLDVRARLPRPDAGADEPLAAVRAILASVRDKGDVAVRELTTRFDGVDIEELRVPSDAGAAALGRIDPNVRDALRAAHDAIEAFHYTQRHEPAPFERDGIRVDSRIVPVDRAGCYVPGGRAVYPSTVLMTAVPARVAGVAEVVLAVPPEPTTGWPPDATLAAAAIAGVDEVYRIGGAQAIAALAYGTETVRPVDVIVGPGNVYVAIAKREVAGEGLVGVPSAFTGPSEVVVVADADSPVALVAIDIVVQAEHGPGGLAWLVTWDESILAAVTAEVDRLVAASPRKRDLEATLGTGGYAVLVDGPDQAIAVANAIAPEHLELMVSAPDELVPLIRHAGAVFCGPWSPASLGDYIAGPSHVLPTFGSARFGQALTVSDFTKHVHVVTATADAVRRAAPHVVALAEAEGLPAHADSVRVRAPS
ncbi:MAG TPA: histidinol dehydrogenase [Acidimicrobiales bacterium]|nr:histidinol dehydrogenase [Acidimicrobiales bacterium]